MKRVSHIIWGLAILSCNNQEKATKQTGINEKEIAVTVIEPSEKNEGNIQGVYGGCGYNYSPSQTGVTLHQPRARELNQINSILKFSGLSSNFKIYGANINNAVATIINNKRYIFYDPKLLSFSDQQSGSYWSSMSILAHEIGHHLSGHTITSKGSNPTDELEADKYSGFILYKLGATLSQATSAIQLLGSDLASPSHPAKSDRIHAITKGWNEANQTRYNGAIPPPPDENIPTDGTAIIEFTKDMLWSNNELKEFLEYNPSNGNGEYFFDEGIIVDIKKESQGRISGIAVYSPDNRENSFINIVNPLESPNMCRACYDWFNEIIKPGRKIKYSIYYGGASGRVFYLSYLKMLPH